MVPFLVVGGLVLLVLWTAGKASVPGAAQDIAQIPPRTDVIPMGGPNGPISPAMSGGSPLLAADNQLRLDTTAPTVGTGWQHTEFNVRTRLNQLANAVQSSASVPSNTPPLPSAQPVAPVRMDAYGSNLPTRKL